jgi:signal transduction histidine kinase
MDNIQKRQHSSSGTGRLAHDLRNSLSVIYSYVQLLELSLTKLQLEKEVRISQVIAREVKKMNVMISESAGEAGEIESHS